MINSKDMGLRSFAQCKFANASSPNEGGNIPCRVRKGEHALGVWLGQVSDGSGSKVFDPGRVNFLLLGLGGVGSVIYGLGLNLENFPYNQQIFNFVDQN